MYRGRKGVLDANGGLASPYTFTLLEPIIPQEDFNKAREVLNEIKSNSQLALRDFTPLLAACRRFCSSESVEWAFELMEMIQAAGLEVCAVVTAI